MLDSSIYFSRRETFFKFSSFRFIITPWIEGLGIAVVTLIASFIDVFPFRSSSSIFLINLLSSLPPPCVRNIKIYYKSSFLRFSSFELLFSKMLENRHSFLQRSTNARNNSPHSFYPAAISPDRIDKSWSRLAIHQIHRS